MDFDDFVRALMDISSHLYKDLDRISSLSEFIKARIVPMSLSLMMERRRRSDGGHVRHYDDDNIMKKDSEEEEIDTIPVKRVVLRKDTFGSENGTSIDSRFGSNEWASQRFEEGPIRTQSRGTLGSHCSSVRRVSSGTIDMELGLENKDEQILEKMKIAQTKEQKSSPRSVLSASTLLRYIRKIFLRKSDIGTKDISGARMSIDVLMRFARDCGLTPEKITRVELLRMLRSRTSHSTHEGISYDMFVELLETIASVCYRETYSNRVMELQMLLFYMDLQAQGSLFNSRIPPVKSIRSTNTKESEEEMSSDNENEFVSSTSSMCAKLRHSMQQFDLYIVIGNSELRLLLRIFKFYATFGERNRVQETPISMTSTRFMKLIRDSRVPRSHRCGTDKASIDLSFESTWVWQRRHTTQKKRRRRRRRLNFACFCIAPIEISRRLYQNHDDEEEDQDHNLFITRSDNVNSRNDKARYGEYLSRLLQDYLTNATSQWNMLSASTGHLSRSATKVQRFKRSRSSFRKERFVDPIVSDEEKEKEVEEKGMKHAVLSSNHEFLTKNSVQLKLENDRARLVDILKRTIHDNRLNAMRRCSIRAQRRLVRSAWARWVLSTRRQSHVAATTNRKRSDDIKALEDDVGSLRMNVKDLQRRLKEATAESWDWKRRFIEKGKTS